MIRLSEEDQADNEQSANPTVRYVSPQFARCANCQKKGG